MIDDNLTSTLQSGPGNYTERFQLFFFQLSSLPRNNTTDVIMIYNYMKNKMEWFDINM